MNTRILLITLAGMALGMALLITGCSSDEQKGAKGESVTDVLVDNLVESTFAAVEPESVDVAYAVDSGNSPQEVTIDSDIVEQDGPAVLDMVLKDNTIHAIVEGGILLHDLTDGNNLLIPFDEPIGAIADLGEKILVGGNNLYTLDGDVLSDEDYQLNLSGPITVLHRHGLNLLIGTTDGLYQLSIGGIRELAQGIHVSALASDFNGGIWVGTGGDGLYFWNGEQFRKRYLSRDSTLFDNVTALTYNHNHLYLGTDRGFYVYDGGRWQPYDLADGLPSETITFINADDWVIKVGTARGAVTFFNNEFKLMPRFERLVVNRLIKADGKYLAATANSGLVMISGGLITTLYDGETKAAPVALEDTY